MSYYLLKQKYTIRQYFVLRRLGISDIFLRYAGKILR